MSKANKGVYAAAITPISASGEPDMDKFVAYCQSLLAAGLSGIAPLGTTGEANSLPFAFRLAAPEALAKSGILPEQVIVGTGACAVADAIDVTRAAVAADLTNVLMLPPFYYKAPSDDGLYDYYSRVIEAVGDDRLRVYLYHFPQMSAVPISLALTRRLKAAFGDIIAGLKDSSGDFANTQAFVSAFDNFDVYPSSEALLSRALEIGAAGIISATTNVSASLVGAAYRASVEERAALQTRLSAVRELITRFAPIPAVKQIAAWRTDDPEWVHVLPPARQLSAEQAADLRTGLEPLETGAPLFRDRPMAA